MLLAAVVSFLIIFAVFLVSVGLGLRIQESMRQKQVTGTLDAVSGAARRVTTSVLVERVRDSFLMRLLKRFQVVKNAERYLAQAGLEWSIARLAGMMAAFAVLGCLVGYILPLPFYRGLSMAGMAALGGLLPYLYVLRKKKERLRLFEAQFPDALDFLARSMRAGHAFSSGLEMLADEMPLPLAKEFRQVYNEQNLGAPIEVALKNLAGRVPLVDVGFFVSAVLLQRETGGNLSEILTKLAFVIRDRFRLRGRVRAASAHGRLTGTILTLMPLVLIIMLTLITPTYLPLMLRDPAGKYMVLGAIVGQVLGYYFIRKIINIKL